MTDRELNRWPVYADDEIEAALAVLKSGKVNQWTGDQVAGFEREYAEHCNASHAIALANGSVALELGLEAAGIGPGDDVIVTPRSFIASASCVVRVGARPVFADIDPQSLNITAGTIAAALTENTKAVIAVHHAGWPCDMDPIMDVARANNLLVIEDCAQAHGATYNGRPVGSIGDIGVFSFCQDKIISTAGEGGMLVLDDTDLWKRAWAIKDHGKSIDAVKREDHAPGFRWLHETIGTNWRMTELQAAIGRIQLRKLPEWSERRRSNAARLAGVLAKLDAVNVPMPGTDCGHAYYRLYARLDLGKLRDDWPYERLIEELTTQGIPVNSGGCAEIYREKAFVDAGLAPGQPLPMASSLTTGYLAFAVHPTLDDEDMQAYCAAVTELIAAASTT